MFYAVRLDGVSLTKDGIELIESKLGISREQTAKEKLIYIAKKCGVNALPFLKLLAAAATERIVNTI